MDLSESLHKLASLGWRVEEKPLSEACNKFSVVVKEHHQLLQQLVSNDHPDQALCSCSRDLASL